MCREQVLEEYLLIFGQPILGDEAQRASLWASFVRAPTFDHQPLMMAHEAVDR
jgi:hypothetical protein